MDYLIGISMLLMGVGFLRAADHPLVAGEVEMAYLERGFGALARYHRLEPTSLTPSVHDHSWLDGVVDLPLNPETEAQVIAYLTGTGRRIDGAKLPEIPQEKIRWAVARFHEVRGNPEKAREIYQIGDPINRWEALAFARVAYRTGKTDDAREALLRVGRWDKLRLELHVFTLLDDLDGSREFLEFLREVLPVELYRRAAYGAELDLAFHEGRWREALVEAGERGLIWEIFAQAHYGEDRQFFQSVEKLQKEGRSLEAEDLLALPAILVDEEMVEILCDGNDSPEIRRRLFLALLPVPHRQDFPDWLWRWKRTQPEQFREDIAFNTIHSFPHTQIAKVLFEILSEDSARNVFLELLLTRDSPNPSLLLDFLETTPCVDAPEWSSVFGSRGTIQNVREEAQSTSLPDGFLADPILILLHARGRDLSLDPLWQALQKNASFQNLPPISRLKYLVAGQFRKVFVDELLARDWSDNELNLAIKFCDVIDWKSDQVPVEVRVKLGRWLNQSYLKLWEHEELSQAVKEAWGFSLNRLNSPKNDLEKLATEFVEQVSRQNGESRDETVRSLREAAFLYSPLALIMEKAFPLADAQENIRREENEHAGVSRRDFDYIVGLTILTGRARLPISRVLPPEDSSMGMSHVRVFLPRRAYLLDHFCRKKSHPIQRMNRALGPEKWAGFEKTLFELAGYPEAKNRNLFQTYLGKYFAISDIMALKLNPILRDWAGDLDPELSLQKIFQRPWGDDELGELEAELLKFPPLYLMQARGPRVGPFGQAFSKVVGKSIPDGQRLPRAARDYETYTELAALGRREPGMREEFLEAATDFLSKNSKGERGYQVLSQVLTLPEWSQEGLDAYLGKLGDAIVEQGGRRSDLAELVSRFSISIPTVTAAQSMGSPLDRARRGLRDDPGNPEMLKIVIQDLVRTGRPMEEAFELLDRCREAAGVLVWEQVLSHLSGRNALRDREGNPIEDLAPAVLDYLYRTEAGALVTMKEGLNPPLVFRVQQSPEDLKRYLAWFKTGGPASYTDWLSVPTALIEEGRIGEALDWLDLGLSPPRNQADFSPLGLGSRGNDDFWKAFAACPDRDRIANHLLADEHPALPRIRDAFLLICSSDPAHHRQVGEVMAHGLDLENEARAFGRNLDDLRGMLRQSKNSAKGLIILERLLYEDERLRGFSRKGSGKGDQGSSQRGND